MHWWSIEVHDIQAYDNIMMTSSNGNIFRVTGPLCREFTGPGEFPTQRPVTRSFDVFFDLRLNKRLSKQPRGWWFETQSWSLWRHCNVQNISVAASKALMYIPVYTTCIHEFATPWKPCTYYWYFVRGINRILIESPHKGRSCSHLIVFCCWI